MKFKKIILLLILSVSLGFSGSLAFAADPSPVVPVGNVPATQTSKPALLTNPLQATSISGILLSLVDLAIFIGTILAILAFIFIGFKFVLAQGNESKLKEAKSWFVSAVIGTAVLISSKVIVEIVKQTLISAGVVDSRVINGN